MDNEQELVKKAKNGDKEAFMALYEIYFEKVFRFVYYKVGKQEESEDITQDVFVKAIEAIKTFRGESTFKSWLIQVAKYTVMDYYREKYKYHTVLLEDYLASSPFEAYEDDIEAEKAYDHQKVLSKLDTILKKLPHHYQQVLRHRFIENLTLKETAKKMQTTIGNVKVLQYRALAKAVKISNNE